MAVVVYVKTALTRGGAGALDAIDGNSLADGYEARVYAGVFSIFTGSTRPAADIISITIIEAV